MKNKFSKRIISFITCSSLILTTYYFASPTKTEYNSFSNGVAATIGKNVTLSNAFYGKSGETEIDLGKTHGWYQVNSPIDEQSLLNDLASWCEDPSRDGKVDFVPNQLQIIGTPSTTELGVQQITLKSKQFSTEYAYDNTLGSGEMVLYYFVGESRVPISDVVTGKSLEGKVKGDLFEDRKLGLKYLSDEIKREYEDLNLNNAEITTDFTDCNIKNEVAKATITALPNSTMYTGSKTLDFNFNLYPDYIPDNATGIFYGKFNDGLGVNNPGSHQWYNMVDGSSTTQTSNATFINNYASIVNTGTTMGYLTNLYQSNLMTNYNFTWETVVRFASLPLSSVECTIIGNPEGAGAGLLINGNSSDLTFWYHDGSKWQTIPVTTVEQNTIYCISVTNNTNDKKEGFSVNINGERCLSSSPIQYISNSAAPLAIGSNPSLSSLSNYGVPGDYFCTRIYNYSLDNSQIEHNWYVDHDLYGANGYVDLKQEIPFDLELPILENLWVDEQTSKEYIKAAIKQQYPDVHTDQIDIFPDYSAVCYERTSAKLKINPVPGSNYYIGTNTILFDVTPHPLYNVEGALAIYNGAYNDTWGRGVNGSHNWLNSYDNTTTSNVASSATFIDNFARVNDNLTQMGLATPFTQNDLFDSSTFDFTWEFDIKFTSTLLANSDRIIFGNLEAGGCGLGTPANKSEIDFIYYTGSSYVYIKLFDSSDIVLNNIYSISVTNDFKNNQFIASLNGQQKYSSTSISYIAPPKDKVLFSIGSNPTPQGLANLGLPADYYCARIYNIPLTPEKLLQNWIIDQELYDIQ